MSVFQVSRIRIRLGAPSGAVVGSPDLDDQRVRGRVDVAHLELLARRVDGSIEGSMGRFYQRHLRAPELTTGAG
jgi:hypothetical protein